LRLVLSFIVASLPLLFAGSLAVCHVLGAGVILFQFGSVYIRVSIPYWLAFPMVGVFVLSTIGLMLTPAAFAAAGAASAALTFSSEGPTVVLARAAQLSSTSAILGVGTMVFAIAFGLLSAWALTDGVIPLLNERYGVLPSGPYAQAACGLAGLSAAVPCGVWLLSQHALITAEHGLLLLMESNRGRAIASTDGQPASHATLDD